MRKKMIYVFILLSLNIFIVGCTNKNIKEREKKEVNINETRAMFVSYIELMNYIKGYDVDTAKANVDKIINNIKDLKFNTIILQVRSFSDAIYNSNIFPWSYTVSAKEGEYPGFDILEYFITKAHENNISLHAWINPYRIRNAGSTVEISESNPAYKWLNTNKVGVVDGGYYYNPAESEVEDLIVEGVKEIIDNYDVDGIHFDDYFYPGDSIDIENYNAYKEKNPDVSIEDYRLDIINNMMKRVYKTIKDTDSTILFGVSPEGNINNNYTKHYADVYTWGSSDGYVDYLMPQIYYGLLNEVKPFIDTTKEWEDLITNPNVALLPALAFYKVGTIDTYASSGANEWIENSDIIMKEIVLGRNLKNYQGFAIFRYDFIFNEELETETTFEEIENMKKVLD